MGTSRIERVAIEVPAQRLEMGDVVLVHLPGEEATVEAKVVRDIERTPTTVRARIRAAEGDDFVHEWNLGELVTVVRGP
jgi:hypothetical protein